MKTRVKTTFAMTPVWKQATAELQAELLEFWQSHRAIGDPQQARRRAVQAVCIARGDDGRLCAVSTALLCVLPRLRQPLYYFRMFLAKSVRGQGHVFPFLNRCRLILQQYNQELAQPESLGVLVELENRHLVAPPFQKAFLEEVGSVFIGYSPRGLPLRVSYFDDARLMKPERVAQIISQADVQPLDASEH